MSLILNTEVLNRNGYRVLTSGILIENYLENPILLFNHNDNALPIGRMNNVRIEQGRLLADPEFDEEDPVALNVKRKYEKGMLNACSIRARPIAVSDNVELLHPGQLRPTVTQCELLEVSMVAIPGNQNAVRLSSTDEELDELLPIIKLEPSIMDKKSIALCLGLDENIAEVEILNAIKVLKSDAIKAQKAQHEILLSLGEQKGLITDKNRDSMQVLLKNNPEQVKQMIETFEMQKKEDELSLAEAIIALKGDNQVNDKEDKANWSFDEYSKKDPDSLLKMRMEEPEKYKKLALAYANK